MLVVLSNVVKVESVPLNPNYPVSAAALRTAAVPGRRSAPAGGGFEAPSNARDSQLWSEGSTPADCVASSRSNSVSGVTDPMSDTTRALHASALSGALTALVLDWADGRLPVSRVDLGAYATRLGLAGLR